MADGDSARRMLLVRADDFREIVKLARAACKMHDSQTHYGTCDVCELVDRWRHLLRAQGVDVNGLAERLAAENHDSRSSSEEP